MPFQRGPGNEQRPDEVHPEHRPDVVGGQALESSVANDAGIVDDRVDAPEIVEGRRYRRPAPSGSATEWVSATASPPAALISSTTC